MVLIGESQIRVRNCLRFESSYLDIEYKGFFRMSSKIKVFLFDWKNLVFVLSLTISIYLLIDLSLLRVIAVFICQGFFFYCGIIPVDDLASRINSATALTIFTIIVLFFLSPWHASLAFVSYLLAFFAGIQIEHIKRQLSNSTEE